MEREKSFGVSRLMILLDNSREFFRGLSLRAWALKSILEVQSVRR